MSNGVNTATHELIDRLAAELKPVPSATAALRLALGIGIGGLVAAAIMLAWLGLRADAAAALSMPSFWIKFAYTLALGSAGCLAVERLGRPGERPRSGATVALAAFAAVVVLAAGQMATTPPGGEMRMLFGGSANFCPVAIVVLSAPIFSGVTLALRGLAPTRLTLCGAGAGFAAGAVAAFVYSFSCGETGIAFLASWYTLGILASTAIGALLGRPLLRW